MPAPRWFWRFLYDRESESWERRRDEPEHRELIESTADQLARFVPPPGPVADLGSGPGAHVRALASRGYAVTGVDSSARMVAVARDRATRDHLNVTFEVADVSKRLPFADGSLGAALAILVIQHLDDPAALMSEIRRCLRPGGHLLLTAPDRGIVPLTTGNVYWRLRAAFAKRVPGMIHFYDLAALRELVEANGFTVIEDEPPIPGSTNLIARA